MHRASSNPHVDWANGYYYFDWRFRTDSDDVFAIKISATRNFLKVNISVKITRYGLGRHLRVLSEFL